MRAIPALYIHLPFCPSKCFFCDFPVIAGPVHSSYTEKLLIDMQETARRFPTSEKLRSVYFGGGTPSLYPDLPLIFQNIHKNWQLDSQCEISLECNPGTIEVDKLRTLKEIGVNRITVGAQIMNDEILKDCNRKHTSADTNKLIEDILRAGFSMQEVCVDVICGLPKVTDEIWNDTLEWLKSVRPGHISCYMLSLEPNTPFHKRYYEGSLELPSDDKVTDMYIQTCNQLKDYDHYEISSFALENRRSVHNSMYWKGDVPFYGIGMGAASYLDNCRFTRPGTLKSYYDFLEKYPEKQFPKEDIIETLRNTFMYQIRRKEGIRYQDYEKYGAKLMSALYYIADSYRDYLVNDSEALRLKDPEGYLISNEVLVDIFIALDNSPRFNLN